MYISKLRLKNWRNFRDASAEDIGDVTYILGANATGKSNLLDALRFLRDIAKFRGGGLQEAIQARGGVAKIRCLHARHDPEVSIEVELVSPSGDPLWQYEVGFTKSKGETHLTKEKVVKFTKDSRPRTVLVRPTSDDEKDPAQLQQSHLEQINTNTKFRDLAIFFAGLTYVHLVPQLVKYRDRIGGRTLESDPFGQEFMLRIAGTQPRSREARLRRIEKALRTIVPQLEDLSFVKDEMTGQPHLEFKFRHYRPQGARQREDQFSDGTLRLLSILWLLQEAGDAPLMLEEPELSLNEQIVRQIPLLIHHIRRQSRAKRQVFITTHSQALLSNPGIDPNGIILVEPSDNGSTLSKARPEELEAMSLGLSAAEVILPRARAGQDQQQLALWEVI